MPLRPDRSGHIPKQAGLGACSQEPVTCDLSPPRRGTGPGPALGSNPAGRGQNHPRRRTAPQSPQPPGRGQRRNGPPPQPRTARPREGTDVRGNPRWLLPAEPARASGGGPSLAPGALPVRLHRPRGRPPCPAPPGLPPAPPAPRPRRAPPRLSRSASARTRRKWRQ